jgi:hypothetical protein
MPAQGDHGVAHIVLDPAPERAEKFADMEDFHDG